MCRLWYLLLYGICSIMHAFNYMGFLQCIACSTTVMLYKFSHIYIWFSDSKYEAYIESFLILSMPQNINHTYLPISHSLTCFFSSCSFLFHNQSRTHSPCVVSMLSWVELSWVECCRKRCLLCGGGDKQHLLSDGGSADRFLSIKVTSPHLTSPHLISLDEEEVGDSIIGIESNRNGEDTGATLMLVEEEAPDRNQLDRHNEIKLKEKELAG